MINKSEKLSNYQKLNIPGLIKIGDYSYVYKDQSKSNPNLFFFRCQKSICRITIEIDRENIDKIVKKNKTGEINYKQKKEHKWVNNNIINSEKIEECSTDDQIYNKAYNIIAINPLKPLTFHKNKLQDMKINLKDDKINRLIYKARNSLYPRDDEYLSNLINITITFDDNTPDSQNIPYCQGINKFFYPNKNRIEEYVIFSSKYHLILLSNGTQIFMDATFKVAPTNFYQLFNVLVYLEEEKICIPFVFVLMTSKSFLAYKKIFQDIKLLLIQNKI